MLTHTDLPDDIAALKVMVLERESALAAKEIFVVELREQVSTHAQEIEHLKRKRSMMAVPCRTVSRVVSAIAPG